MRRHHRLPSGAEPTPDGVRFRLWAPRAEAVSVQLEGAKPATCPMTSEPGGWFSLTTAKAGPGSLYRYLVDGRAFPDPASRHQPEGVHGPTQAADGSVTITFSGTGDFVGPSNISITSSSSARPRWS